MISHNHAISDTALLSLLGLCRVSCWLTCWLSLLLVGWTIATSYCTVWVQSPSSLYRVYSMAHHTVWVQSPSSLYRVYSMAHHTVWVQSPSSLYRVYSMADHTVQVNVQLHYHSLPGSTAIQSSRCVCVVVCTNLCHQNVHSCVCSHQLSSSPFCIIWQPCVTFSRTTRHSQRSITVSGRTLWNSLKQTVHHRSLTVHLEDCVILPSLWNII